MTTGHASTDETGQREPVGTAAQEAARFAEALHGWWVRRDEGPGDEPDGAPDAGTDAPTRADLGAGGAGAGTATEDAHDPHAHRGDSDAACRYCPLCRGIAAAQSLRPEVVQHLLSAAESVAAALRELAADQPAARPHPGPDPTGPNSARTVTIPVEQDDTDHRGSTHDEAQEGL